MTDPAEIRDTVVEAEALGFDAVTLPEHLLPPAWPTAEVSTKFWYDTATLAAFLAGSTSRIRFLTSVMVAPYHPPIQAAKALATLDVLSAGRLLLGVGTGWMRAEFRRLGLDFRRRAAMTDEYLRAMVELWTSETPAFAGEFVQFEDVSFLPKPVQQPIPLLIGGAGAGPFRRVAEVGHGWFPMTATPEQIRSGIEQIRGLRVSAGRGGEALWVGYSGVSMGNDLETAGMRSHVDGSPATDAPGKKSPEEMVREIEAYREAGVNFLSVGFSWRNGAELRAGLRRFAADVLPAFA
jgi:probable F420-dependent oxidoreductase